MLTIEIDARDLERARLLMERYPERLRQALYKANINSGAVLLRRIKLALSGEKLRVRTGNLRRNWAQIMPRIAENENAWVGGVGSGNTEYAAYHEFGFQGDVQVRAHTRNVTQVYGHAVSGVTASVRAHSRHVDYKGRPYARPALNESKDRIEAIHSDQIRQAWEKSK